MTQFIHNIRTPDGGIIEAATDAEMIDFLEDMIAEIKAGPIGEHIRIRVQYANAADGIEEKFETSTDR